MVQIRKYFSKGQQQKKSAHKPEHLPVLVRITSRRPVPLDPSRPSLAQLPDDVVLLVLTFVEESDLRTIASLSSLLYEHARHVQHHTMYIDLDKHRKAQGLLDILACNLLLPAVRVLEVRDSNDRKINQEGREEGELLSRLTNMLPRMTGLRDLHWQIPRPSMHDSSWPMSAPIPRAFLNHIPMSTRLHTSVAALDEPHDLARAFLVQLVDNQNLFSLSVEIAFIDELLCRTTTRILKQVLLSCPRLARLPLLSIGPPFRRGDPWDGPGMVAPYCGLGFSGGERPPALEELCMTYYPWGVEPTPGRALPVLYSLGYPEKNSEVWYWAEMFDWSKLRRMSYIPSILALEIAPKLTALEEFDYTEKFALCWSERELTTFLEQIPTGLEVLSVPRWSNASNNPNPITRHGTSLRNLKIHHKEPWMVDSLMTYADLTTLCNGLPRLAELALDIRRDETKHSWPYSTLDIIAMFPNLRSVKLWFELRDERFAPPMPYVTVSETHHLFAYLRERNKKIQHLDLCSGAPNGWSWDGEPSWATQNSIHLVCEVSIQNGDAADGFARVTCPNFSTDMNLELGRLAKKTRRGKRGVAEDATRLLLEVALDGPLTFEEWLGWNKRLRERSEKARRQQIPLSKRLVSTASSCISSVEDGLLWVVGVSVNCILKK
ncbi:hypothetical protein V8E51_019913 [Hyaloscypha variabilis]